MSEQQTADPDDHRITVELKDGSIVRINTVDHRENPNGDGLLFDVDYDILKLGSLPEDEIFDVMWAQVKPTFLHVLMKDPDVRAGVEARLQASRTDEQVPAPASRRRTPSGP